MDEDMTYNEAREKLNSLCWWLVNEEGKEIVDSVNEVLFIENGGHSYFEYDDYRYLVLEEDELNELLSNEFVDNIIKYGGCVRDYSPLFQEFSKQAQDEFVDMYDHATPMMQLFLLDSLDVDYLELYEQVKSDWSNDSLIEAILECKEVYVDREYSYLIIKFLKNDDFFKKGEQK